MRRVGELSVALKAAGTAAGAMLLLTLLSPLTAVGAAVLFVVSVVALCMRVAQQKSVVRWGVAAAASLVLAFAAAGVSSALYGGSRPGGESSPREVAGSYDGSAPDPAEAPSEGGPEGQYEVMEEMATASGLDVDYLYEDAALASEGPMASLYGPEGAVKSWLGTQAALSGPEVSSENALLYSQGATALDVERLKAEVSSDPMLIGQFVESIPAGEAMNTDLATEDGAAMLNEVAENLLGSAGRFVSSETGGTEGNITHTIYAGQLARLLMEQYGITWMDEDEFLALIGDVARTPDLLSEGSREVEAELEGTY